MPAYRATPLKRRFLLALLLLIISVTGLKATAEQQIFSGNNLIVTAIIETPFVLFKRNHSDLQGNDRFEGFLIDLLSMLAKDANFTYDIRLVKDVQYGSYDKSVSKGIYVVTGWNGMIGELINREADLAVGALTITQNRSLVVDFTEPFLGAGVTILIKKPTHYDPPEPILLPFNDFEQLVNQTEIQYGAMANGSTMAFLKTSTAELHKKLWNYLSAHPENHVQWNEEGIHRVRSGSGRYAFIAERHIAHYVAARPPCDVTTVGELATFKGYGIALQKNSPWTERLSSLITQWKSDGTITHLFEKWWRNWPRTCPEFSA